MHNLHFLGEVPLYYWCWDRGIVRKENLLRTKIRISTSEKTTRSLVNFSAKLQVNRTHLKCDTNDDEFEWIRMCPITKPNQRQNPDEKFPFFFRRAVKFLCKVNTTEEEIFATFKMRCVNYRPTHPRLGYELSRYLPMYIYVTSVFIINTYVDNRL